MSETLPTEVTPALAAVGTLQLVLLLAGLWVLWTAVLSPPTRQRFRAASPLPPWNLSLGDFLAAALFVIGGGLVVQIATALTIRHLAADSLGADPELNLVVQGAAFQIGLLVGAALAALFTRGRTTPEAATAPAPRIGLLRGGVGAFLAALPAVTALNLAWAGLLMLFDVEAPPQELVFLMVEAESPLTTALLILFAVVVAPLAEELVFRAGFFRFLRTRTPKWVAYLLPATIFGALHGNLAAFVPLTALAIAFAIAYERTGRIGVPILAHALFNLNTVVLLFAGVAI